MPRGKGRRSWFIVRLIALGIWALLLGLCPAHSVLADEGSIEPAPNEETLGEVSIYCILDDACLCGLGHTGLIVSDGTRHWYYSFGEWGFIEEDFPTLEEAFAYAKSDDPHNTYRREEHWRITTAQAMRAKDVAAAEAGKKYNLLTHNCWHLVYYAILSAVGETRIQFYSRQPSLAFCANRRLADGSSDL